MAETIVIKKDYFTNIETAVNAINKFFQTNYQEKDFPVIDGFSDMDPTIKRILDSLNSVEPSWIDDTSKVDNTINEINDAARTVDVDNPDEVYPELVSSNKTIADKLDAFTAFKSLQKIADHFDEFSAILNGIHSFELFTTPSKFRSEIELFSSPIDMSLVSKVTGGRTFSIINLDDYVHGIFTSDQITLPASLNEETEKERVRNFQPLSSDIQITTDQTIQEAAEINYFKDAKPKHIKYDSKNNRFVISDQFKKVVDSIINGISKCNTSKELKAYFASAEASGKGSESIPDMLSENVMPFILEKVYSNPKKFPEDNINDKQMKKFSDSYKSINSKNPGTRRFVNYDVFSTFKVDKDGTVKFLKDFLTLNLVNSPNCAITNNGLLSCFNIFDSRIYLDTLYNLIPAEDKKDKYATEDQFVKYIRARINKASRNSNVYAEDDETKIGDNKTKTAKEVQESVYITMKQFGDMDVTDMHLCEQYRTALFDELNMLDSKVFSEGISMLDIGENIEMIQENHDGSIPEYMQTRVKLSDDVGVSVTPVSVPTDIPTNPIPDLADSIDDKIGSADEYGNLLGSNANTTGGNVVYNITNNYTYNNSYNKKNINQNKKNVTHTTDNSTGKTVTTTKHDQSTGKTITNKKVTKDSYNKKLDRKDLRVNDVPFNNNNNSEDHNDTSSTHEPPLPDFSNEETLQEFSSGISVGQLFAFLEDGEAGSLTASMGKEEPLSSEIGPMEKPSSDLLTTAMDVDRNTLSLQQRMKKGTNKLVQTVDAVTKPITRAKQWLAGIVDSLIERNEEKVKREIIENPSYRTTLFKASRLALKLGLAGILYTINGYIAAAYAIVEVTKGIDKERLKKDLQGEYVVEIQAIDEKINYLKTVDSPEARKELYQWMRIRERMVRIVSDTPKSLFKTSKTIV